MSEEANHLGIRTWADKSHVAVSEGTIDLQVEARLGCWVSVFSEGFYSIGRQVKVETVCTDLRRGHLELKKAGKEKLPDQMMSQKIKPTRKMIDVVHDNS